jgi:cytochrome c oxidase subunit II
VPWRAGEPVQSTLTAAGPAAQDIVTLTYVFTIGTVLILLGVIALLTYAVVRGPGRASTGLWVVGGGVVFPAVVLSALLFYSTRMTDALAGAAPPRATRIEVEGRQWWWEVRYPDAAGDSVVAANEIHLPLGTAADLVLTSPDVIHSFWVPNLGGKVDMVPGRVNRLTLRADRAGVYRGQCAEYCGTQHAQMALVVVVETPQAFTAWLLAEAATARAPTTPEGTRGLGAFHLQGCGGCHTIRGTGALGRLGPDLTHVASRRTLAAGTLANDAATLRAWIANGHVHKPGNLMPSFRHLDGETLDALTAYLASLR